jgi:DNA-binding NtrC family response regulator
MPAGSGQDGATVLLIDRDGGTRAAVAAALRDNGFAVIEARSERSGFDLLGKRDDLDAVIFAQPARPDRALRETRKLQPAARIVLLTPSEAANAPAGEVIGEGGLLTFPYPPEPYHLAYMLARMLLAR